MPDKIDGCDFDHVVVWREASGFEVKDADARCSGRAEGHRLV
jgi:hypothetical protein